MDAESWSSEEGLTAPSSNELYDILESTNIAVDLSTSSAGAIAPDTPLASTVCFSSSSTYSSVSSSPVIVPSSSIYVASTPVIVSPSPAFVSSSASGFSTPVIVPSPPVLVPSSPLVNSYVPSIVSPAAAPSFLPYSSLPSLTSQSSGVAPPMSIPLLSPVSVNSSQSFQREIQLGAGVRNNSIIVNNGTPASMNNGANLNNDTIRTDIPASANIGAFNSTGSGINNVLNAVPIVNNTTYINLNNESKFMNANLNVLHSAMKSLDDTQNSNCNDTNIVRANVESLHLSQGSESTNDSKSVESVLSSLERNNSIVVIKRDGNNSRQTFAPRTVAPVVSNQERSALELGQIMKRPSSLRSNVLYSPSKPEETANFVKFGNELVQLKTYDSLEKQIVMDTNQSLQNSTVGVAEINQEKTQVELGKPQNFVKIVQKYGGKKYCTILGPATVGSSGAHNVGTVQNQVRPVNVGPGSVSLSVIRSPTATLIPNKIRAPSVEPWKQPQVINIKNSPVVSSNEIRTRLLNRVTTPQSKTFDRSNVIQTNPCASNVVKIPVNHQTVLAQNEPRELLPQQSSVTLTPRNLDTSSDFNQQPGNKQSVVVVNPGLVMLNSAQSEGTILRQNNHSSGSVVAVRPPAPSNPVGLVTVRPSMPLDPSGPATLRPSVTVNQLRPLVTAHSTLPNIPGVNRNVNFNENSSQMTFTGSNLSAPIVTRSLPLVNLPLQQSLVINQSQSVNLSTVESLNKPGDFIGITNTGQMIWLKRITPDATSTNLTSSTPSYSNLPYVATNNPTIPFNHNSIIPPLNVNNPSVSPANSTVPLIQATSNAYITLIPDSSPGKVVSNIGSVPLVADTNVVSNTIHKDQSCSNTDASVPMLPTFGVNQLSSSNLNNLAYIDPANGMPLSSTTDSCLPSNIVTTNSIISNVGIPTSSSDIDSPHFSINDNDMAAGSNAVNHTLVSNVNTIQTQINHSNNNSIETLPAPYSSPASTLQTIFPNHTMIDNTSLPISDVHSPTNENYGSVPAICSEPSSDCVDQNLCSVNDNTRYSVSTPTSDILIDGPLDSPHNYVQSPHSYNDEYQTVPKNTLSTNVTSHFEVTNSLESTSSFQNNFPTGDDRMTPRATSSSGLTTCDIQPTLVDKESEVSETDFCHSESEEMTADIPEELLTDEQVPNSYGVVSMTQSEPEDIILESENQLESAESSSATISSNLPVTDQCCHNSDDTNSNTVSSEIDSFSSSVDYTRMGLDGSHDTASFTQTFKTIPIRGKNYRRYGRKRRRGGRRGKAYKNVSSDDRIIPSKVFPSIDEVLVHDNPQNDTESVDTKNELTDIISENTHLDDGVATKTNRGPESVSSKLDCYDFKEDSNSSSPLVLGGRLSRRSKRIVLTSQDKIASPVSDEGKLGKTKGRNLNSCEAQPSLLSESHPRKKMPINFNISSPNVSEINESPEKISPVTHRKIKQLKKYNKKTKESVDDLDDNKETMNSSSLLRNNINIEPLNEERGKGCIENKYEDNRKNISNDQDRTIRPFKIKINKLQSGQLTVQLNEDMTTSFSSSDTLKGSKKKNGKKSSQKQKYSKKKISTLSKLECSAIEKTELNTLESNKVNLDALSTIEIAVTEHSDYIPSTAEESLESDTNVNSRAAHETGKQLLTPDKKSKTSCLQPSIAVGYCKPSPRSKKPKEFLSLEEGSCENVAHEETITDVKHVTRKIMFENVSNNTPLKKPIVSLVSVNEYILNKLLAENGLTLSLANSKLLKLKSKNKDVMEDISHSDVVSKPSTKGRRSKKLLKASKNNKNIICKKIYQLNTRSSSKDCKTGCDVEESGSGEKVSTTAVISEENAVQTLASEENVLPTTESSATLLPEEQLLTEKCADDYSHGETNVSTLPSNQFQRLLPSEEAVETSPAEKIIVEFTSEENVNVVPCEEKFNEPCEENVTVEPCEENVTVEPCEENVTVEPCEEIVNVMPCEENVNVKSCEENVNVKSCDESVIGEPCEENVNVKSCEENINMVPCDENLDLMREETINVVSYEGSAAVQPCEEISTVLSSDVPAEILSVGENEEISENEALVTKVQPDGSDRSEPSAEGSNNLSLSLHTAPVSSSVPVTSCLAQGCDSVCESPIVSLPKAEDVENSTSAIDFYGGNADNPTPVTSPTCSTAADEIDALDSRPETFKDEAEGSFTFLGFEADADDSSQPHLISKFDEVVSCSQNMTDNSRPSSSQSIELTLSLSPDPHEDAFSQSTIPSYNDAYDDVSNDNDVGDVSITMEDEGLQEMPESSETLLLNEEEICTTHVEVTAEPTPCNNELDHTLQVKDVIVNSVSNSTCNIGSEVIPPITTDGNFDLTDGVDEKSASNDSNDQKCASDAGINEKCTSNDSINGKVTPDLTEEAPSEDTTSDSDSDSEEHNPAEGGANKAALVVYPRHRRVAVLKYQPPLGENKVPGNYPFSDSLRRIMQSSPGSIHKRRPRMKVTPIIPSSLCKPKLSAGDTYVFSETESHFIDLTKFSSKLLSAKNKKNTSSPSHRPSTPLSTDPNQICSGKSEEVADEEPSIPEVSFPAPIPRKKKKKSQKAHDCIEAMNKVLRRLKLLPQVEEKTSDGESPSYVERKCDFALNSSPLSTTSNDASPANNTASNIQINASFNAYDVPGSFNSATCDKIDALSTSNEETNISASSPKNLVPSTKNNSKSSASTLVPITVKEIQKIMAIKKVKSYDDFKLNILNHLGEDKVAGPLVQCFKLPKNRIELEKNMSSEILSEKTKDQANVRENPIVTSNGIDSQPCEHATGSITDGTNNEKNENFGADTITNSAGPVIDTARQDQSKAVQSPETSVTAEFVDSPMSQRNPETKLSKSKTASKKKTKEVPVVRPAECPLTPSELWREVAKELDLLTAQRKEETRENIRRARARAVITKNLMKCQQKREASIANAKRIFEMNRANKLKILERANTTKKFQNMLSSNVSSAKIISNVPLSRPFPLSKSSFGSKSTHLKKKFFFSAASKPRSIMSGPHTKFKIGPRSALLSSLSYSSRNIIRRPKKQPYISHIKSDPNLVTPGEFLSLLKLFHDGVHVDPNSCILHELSSFPLKSQLSEIDSSKENNTLLPDTKLPSSSSNDEEGLLKSSEMAKMVKIELYHGIVQVNSYFEAILSNGGLEEDFDLHNKGQHLESTIDLDEPPTTSLKSADLVKSFVDPVNPLANPVKLSANTTESSQDVKTTLEPVKSALYTTDKQSVNSIKSTENGGLGSVKTETDVAKLVSESEVKAEDCDVKGKEEKNLHDLINGVSEDSGSEYDSDTDDEDALGQQFDVSRLRPFVEPVSHYVSQSRQLICSARIVVKRLRYVHIVNKFCKRHDINLRSAFRIRRRLRYWQDREDEAAIIEASKDAPIHLEEFFSHCIFADALMDPDQLRAAKRKRIMIEFDRIKRWEEYDDEFCDNIYAKKFKRSIVFRDSITHNEDTHTLLREDNRHFHGRESSNMAINDPSLYQRNASLPSNSLIVRSIHSSVRMIGDHFHQTRESGIQDTNNAPGIFKVPSALPKNSKTGEMSIPHDENTQRWRAIPATPVTPVFNYDKRRYEVLPLNTVNKRAQNNLLRERLSLPSSTSQGHVPAAGVYPPPYPTKTNTTYGTSPTPPGAGDTSLNVNNVKAAHGNACPSLLQQQLLLQQQRLQQMQLLEKQQGSIYSDLHKAVQLEKAVDLQLRQHLAPQQRQIMLQQQKLLQQEIHTMQQRLQVVLQHRRDLQQKLQQLQLQLSQTAQQNSRASVSPSHSGTTTTPSPVSAPHNPSITPPGPRPVTQRWKEPQSSYPPPTHCSTSNQLNRFNPPAASQPPMPRLKFGPNPRFPLRSPPPPSVPQSHTNPPLPGDAQQTLAAHSRVEEPPATKTTVDRSQLFKLALVQLDIKEKELQKTIHEIETQIFAQVSPYRQQMLQRLMLQQQGLLHEVLQQKGKLKNFYNLITKSDQGSASQESTQINAHTSGRLMSDFSNAERDSKKEPAPQPTLPPKYDEAVSQLLSKKRDLQVSLTVNNKNAIPIINSDKKETIYTSSHSTMNKVSAPIPNPGCQVPISTNVSPNSLEANLLPNRSLSAGIGPARVSTQTWTPSRSPSSLENSLSPRSSSSSPGGSSIDRFSPLGGFTPPPPLLQLKGNTNSTNSSPNLISNPIMKPPTLQRSVSPGNGKSKWNSSCPSPPPLRMALQTPPPMVQMRRGIQPPSSVFKIPSPPPLQHRGGALLPHLKRKQSHELSPVKSSKERTDGPQCNIEKVTANIESSDTSRLNNLQKGCHETSVSSREGSQIDNLSASNMQQQTTVHISNKSSSRDPSTLSIDKNPLSISNLVPQNIPNHTNTVEKLSSLTINSKKEVVSSLSEKQTELNLKSVDEFNIAFNDTGISSENSDKPLEISERDSSDDMKSVQEIIRNIDTSCTSILVCSVEKKENPASTEKQKIISTAGADSKEDMPADDDSVFHDTEDRSDTPDHDREINTPDEVQKRDSSVCKQQETSNPPEEGMFGLLVKDLEENELDASYKLHGYKRKSLPEAASPLPRKKPSIENDELSASEVAKEFLSETDSSIQCKNTNNSCYEVCKDNDASTTCGKNKRSYDILSLLNDESYDPLCATSKRQKIDNTEISDELSDGKLQAMEKGAAGKNKAASDLKPQKDTEKAVLTSLIEEPLLNSQTKNSEDFLDTKMEGRFTFERESLTSNYGNGSSDKIVSPEKGKIPSGEQTLLSSCETVDSVNDEFTSVFERANSNQQCEKVRFTLELEKSNAEKERGKGDTLLEKNSSGNDQHSAKSIQRQQEEKDDNPTQKDNVPPETVESCSSPAKLPLHKIKSEKEECNENIVLSMAGVFDNPGVSISSDEIEFENTEEFKEEKTDVDSDGCEDMIDSIPVDLDIADDPSVNDVRLTVNAALASNSNTAIGLPVPPVPTLAINNRKENGAPPLLHPHTGANGGSLNRCMPPLVRAPSLRRDAPAAPQLLSWVQSTSSQAKRVLKQTQLPAIKPPQESSSSVKEPTTPRLLLTMDNDPAGETMLSFGSSEIAHCGRADPDNARTSAQVSPIVNVIRLAVCAGYPLLEHKIRSAVYNLSLAWGICCQHHALGLARWPGLMLMFGHSSLYGGQGKLFSPPIVPHIPAVDRGPRKPGDEKVRSLIIVERLVFAVDKRSREVFLPLPNWVEGVRKVHFDGLNSVGDAGSSKTQGKDRPSIVPISPNPPDPSSVELLSVLVSFTQMGELLPGLVVFPGALMTYRLRHSLDNSERGRDWILASCGAWSNKVGKCSLVGESETPTNVNGSRVCSCPPPHLRASDRGAVEEYLSRLVVGWGRAHLPQPLFLHLPPHLHYTVTGKYSVGGGAQSWSLGRESASGEPHTHVIPHADRVIQDVGIVTSTNECVSMILAERISSNWGLMVRQWTSKHGALLEHSFPAFLLHFLPLLLPPSLIKRFSSAAGLDTFDRKRMELFNTHTAPYRIRWSQKTK